MIIIDAIDAEVQSQERPISIVSPLCRLSCDASSAEECSGPPKFVNRYYKPSSQTRLTLEIRRCDVTSLTGLTRDDTF